MSGYRKYYVMLIYNRIYNYNEGIIKNRFFGVGGWGFGRLASGYFYPSLSNSLIDLRPRDLNVKP
jgi:hypothetical protein